MGMSGTIFEEVEERRSWNVLRKCRDESSG